MSEARAGLVETFWSVQGEGQNAGRPAFFVRFAGCNLDCHFADGSVCDTPWQKTRVKMSVDEILTVAKEAAAPMPHVNRKEWQPMLVLTGGEPTMQPCLIELVDRAKRAGFYVAIETNGTRWTDAFAMLDWISLSPKDAIEHGNPIDIDPTVHPRLTRYMRDHVIGEYRYVITEYSEQPPWYFAAAHFVSPATLADGQGQEHIKGFPGFVPGAVARCLEIVQEDPRWRLSLQTHKFLGVR